MRKLFKVKWNDTEFNEDHEMVISADCAEYAITTAKEQDETDEHSVNFTAIEI